MSHTGGGSKTDPPHLTGAQYSQFFENLISIGFKKVGQKEKVMLTEIVDAAKETSCDVLEGLIKDWKDVPKAIRDGALREDFERWWPKKKR